MLVGLAVSTMISASSASAFTSIGGADGQGFAGCDAGNTWVQETTDSASPTYAVPAGGGVITSWSHDVSSDTGATAVLRLKLFRVTGSSTYLTVGESQAVTDLSDGLKTFPTRISVSGGELLGLHTSGTGIDCFRAGVGSDRTEATPGADPPVNTTFTGVFANTFLLNVAAVIEADADADGFGDETQDDCPTDASTQGACPDADNDGVFDAQDNCPTIAGPASNNGCPPDADGDGTPDAQDNCPAVQGPASNAGCPLPDTSPPETTINSGPIKTDSRKVAFGFSSNEAGSTFRCKLTGKWVKKDSQKRYGPCTSKKKYKRLDPGRYKFFVHATDAAGNFDPTPAKQKFKIIVD